MFCNRNFNKYIQLVIPALLLGTMALGQRIYTIGPMFHLNFGNKKIQSSWGIEAAVWDFSEVYPYGFDAGLEWQKQKFRIYAEAQTGLVFAGTSGGFGCQFQKQSAPKLFIQGSLWANVFIGLDVRFRTTKEDWLAPGVYTKIPIIPGGIKQFNKEYEENHPGKDSSFDFDDDDDWD